MIERSFDVSFVANLALREKQIQQNYRPIIAVHKWFARRPGTLFRALLLSEFESSPLSDVFYCGHKLTGTRVCDPFMGGGTPLLEANRVGCDVIGYDINPMSHWIVGEELSHINLADYRAAGARLRKDLEKQIGHLYRTKCLCCGSQNASVKYFLWVKVQACPKCERTVDLFPGYLLAEDVRHPKNVFVCSGCGTLCETADRKNPGACRECGKRLSLHGSAKRNRCDCLYCGSTIKYPSASRGPLGHRVFAIEYYCPACKPEHEGRFFKKPDSDDLKRISEAEDSLREMEGRFIPDEKIPAGDETGRLHRWGYQRYREMFNARQLVGLELSCRLIALQSSERIRHALATNLSDLLRYQNMLCRYDTMALKSLDIFSVHGFPVGLIQCESNLLGIANGGTETSVGSGGWANILDKYAKAKAYCDKPFEVRHVRGRKVKVSIPDEWIGEHRNGVHQPEFRSVDLRCGDSAAADLAPGSLDAVLTDPPYFGNVQYAELMDFCYVWLRRLAGEGKGCFQEASTRNVAELTGNESMNRGLAHFTEGLSRVFTKMNSALKPEAPLAFTYHHNTLEAYSPIGVALLDAQFTCTAALPCPAEMGASIHINGTGSSILDTVFVCRKRNAVTARNCADTLNTLLQADEQALRQAGVNVSAGDMRCLSFGHLTRLAIEDLAATWNPGGSIEAKLQRFRDTLAQLKSSPSPLAVDHRHPEFEAIPAL